MDRDYLMSILTYDEDTGIFSRVIEKAYTNLLISIFARTHKVMCASSSTKNHTTHTAWRGFLFMGICQTLLTILMAIKLTTEFKILEHAQKARML